MWKDPIVTETRQLREQYASQFAHNADAIFQDILRRQSMPGKSLVAFQPRRPVLVPTATQPANAPDRAHTAVQGRKT
jgi:hypothetical protein